MSKLRKPVGPPGTLDEWAHRFELLADPTRLRLLTHMHLHPGCPVNELADAAGITQTAASQALRVLREQNWVRATRDGRLSRYELIDGGVHHILHFMGHHH